MKFKKEIIAIFFASLFFVSSSGHAKDQSAADSYQRCAACHLSEGQGVPGAFPPLKNRVARIVASPEGREYIVKVIDKGLMGPLEVSGQQYVGVMPAQGSAYSTEQLTQLLNYLVKDLDGSNMARGWVAFTKSEVESVRAQAASVMSNATLRKQLIKKYPKLK